MPGAEVYSDLLVYTGLRMLGFISVVLSFVWGFVKFVLPRWREEEAARAAQPTSVQALRQAA